MTCKLIYVKDLMVPIEEYSTINVTDSLEDAINILKRSFTQIDGIIDGHRSLIVLDNGKPVGILTIRNILKSLKVKMKKKSLFGIIPWNKWSKEDKEMSKEIKVYEVMRDFKVATIGADDYIQNVAYLMVQKGINIVPVMAGDKLVGIIRNIDVFGVIHDIAEC